MSKSDFGIPAAFAILELTKLGGMTAAMARRRFDAGQGRPASTLRVPREQRLFPGEGSPRFAAAVHH